MDDCTSLDISNFCGYGGTEKEAVIDLKTDLEKALEDLADLLDDFEKANVRTEFKA